LAFSASGIIASPSQEIAEFSSFLDFLSFLNLPIPGVFMETENDTQATILPPAPLYVVVDTETGGLFPEKHALLSICFIIVDKDLNVLDEFDHKILPNPAYGIDPKAAEINGYKPDTWASMAQGFDHLQADRTFTQHIDQWFPAAMTDPSRKVMAVAHNATFDQRFVKQHLPNTFARFYPTWICTMWGLRQWRKRTGNDGNAKLATLAELAGFDFKGAAHRSSADTQACLHGWRWLIAQANQAQPPANAG
jgi:DNA polymerase III epsilon subunit-like protein